MVTYNCKGCSFSVSHLQMTARVTPDGGLRELRAWADHRLVPLQGRPNRHWMQGRNQALFSAATSPPLEITAAASAAASTPPLGLMVQPWLGLIGSLGAPRFTQHHINCSHRRRHASTCAHLTSGVHRLVAVTFWGDAALKHNHSAQVAAFDRGGPRLSTTANLLRVRRPAAAAATAATAAPGRGRCEAYLGIGHLHRGEGKLNRRMKMSRNHHNPAAGSSRSALRRRQREGEGR